MSRSLIHFVEAGANLVASPPELIPAWCALPEKKYVAMGPVYAQLQVPVAEELRNIRERGRLAVLVAMGSSANRGRVAQCLTYGRRDHLPERGLPVGRGS